MVMLLERQQQNLLDIWGAPAELARSHWTYRGPRRKRHILVDGPRGGGKTTGLLAVFYELCKTYPGFHFLSLRKTRVSQTSTVLKGWEDLLASDHTPYTLPSGEVVLFGPYALQGATRLNRHIYQFPNGSEMEPSGLDDVRNLKGGNYDGILLDEANQADKADWHDLVGAMRNWCHPQLLEQLFVFLTNPDVKHHWLLKEAEAGRIERIQSWIWDNPKFHTGAGRADLFTTNKPQYDAEIAAALRGEGGWTAEGREHVRDMHARLTGPALERDLYGEWTGAGGLCFPEYNPGIHELDGEVHQEKGRHWIDVQGWDQPVEIAWYGISMDFGFTNTHPGVLQVWAVDGRGRSFLTVQVARTGLLNSEWAEKIAYYHKLYPFECGVGDSEDPEHIETINRRMEHVRDHDGERFMVRADKRGGKPHLIDQMREYISPRKEGGPRLFILKNSMVEGPDPTLLDLGRPVNLQEEVISYRYKPLKEDETLLDERPVKDKDDNVDGAQYWCRFVEGRLGQLPKFFKPTTFSGRIDRMIWEWRERQREDELLREREYVR